VNGRGSPEFRPVSFGPALRSAWQLARGSLLTLLVAAFVVFLPATLAGVVSGLLFPDVPPIMLIVAAGLLGVAFTAPLLGGLNLLTLERARGGEVAPGMVFSGRAYGTRILSYGIVLVVLALLPELLGPAVGQPLLLVGQVLLIFTAFFIVDRELPAGQAMLASVRLAVSMPGTMLLWLLLSAVFGVVAAFTFGIGLIWLIPLSLVLTATLYDRATADR